ncbi:DUF1330 domain-containing protein [Siculibacillus lacustris]|uniref:DUF1330 domain-containing protein n=1 Tax=Siculibacillus lacustris TaxID=1549641 RepID=A0A4Q9VLN1_9HYPH|nr:DUF1330 domain-containing protein [Siculibacillus lacustris]TBW36430.1 DUF1330 domain-containing protein [Siculibacillus lacustris]
MAAYLIADTLLTDPDAYEAYKAQARPLAEKWGGEYVARGGALAVKEDDLWTPSRLVIVRFPSFEQANAFYDSPDYAAILPIAEGSAKRTVVIVDGL